MRSLAEYVMRQMHHKVLRGLKAPSKDNTGGGGGEA